MKKCPECNRTYSDDTITFCLADGSLLSAPYDPEAAIPRSGRAEPPPTEIMPAADSRPLPSTQPAGNARPFQSTILASPGIGSHQEPGVDRAVSPRRTPSRLPWIIGSIALVIIVGVAMVILIGGLKWFSAAGNRQEEKIATQNQPSLPTAVPVEKPDPSPAAPTTTVQTQLPPATPSPSVSPSALTPKQQAR